MDIVVYFLGLVVSGVALFYLLYMRAKRKTIIAKYKKDSKEMRLYSKILQPKWLVIVGLVFIVSAASIIRVVVSTPPDSKSSPLFVLGMLSSLSAVVALSVYYQQRSENKAK